MQIVPFTSEPSQTLKVVLGSTKLLLAARYNDAAPMWTFDVTRDSDGVVLLSNVPLLIGQDMLAPYALGLGGLVAADLSGAPLDAGPDDLGDRVIVTWLSPDELAALKANGAAL